ncbi:MAG: hypothetical protein OXI79_12330 [Gammaproteobacteria bacterium]|nr:hypothetical protein [Gammaproteobacteria bacterium]
MSRRTIHEWVSTGQQLDRDLTSGRVRYSLRPVATHKLDPYKAIIDERLAKYPKLSAKRLHVEVREAGFAGGYSRVRTMWCAAASRARALAT